MSYAIVRASGKQHRVAAGERLTVHRMDAEVGSELDFGEVLLLGSESGAKIGAPVVEGATVRAKVLKHSRGEKVLVFKKNRRKRYHKMMGHRQELTELQIVSIGG